MLESSATTMFEASSCSALFLADLVLLSGVSGCSFRFASGDRDRDRDGLGSRGCGCSSWSCPWRSLCGSAAFSGAVWFWEYRNPWNSSSSMSRSLAVSGPEGSCSRVDCSISSGSGAYALSRSRSAACRARILLSFAFDSGVITPLTRFSRAGQVGRSAS